MDARFRDADDDFEATPDVNVTPLIDVMLVLLIIFMVAAPLATVDVHVDLPVSTARPQERPKRPVHLSIRADLSLAVGESTVARDRLAEALVAATDGDRETRIFLRADRTVDYGRLMEVMNLVRDAGFARIALVGLEAPTAGRTAPTPPEIPSPALGAAP